MDFFDFSGIVPALPGLWNGMIMTLKLMVLGVIGGVALGTVLALMRLSSSKWMANLAGAYVNYFRSIPLLLVITWFYLAVPFVLRWITGEDTPIGAFESCMVAFVMFEAAYFCEIVRAGVQAIPKGQMGAAKALGMSYGQAMRLIILPQAYRIIIPPLTSEFLNVFKNSSVASLIGLMELLAQTKQTAEFSANLFEAFTLATLIYFTLNMSLMLLMRVVEKKVAVPGLISVGGK